MAMEHQLARELAEATDAGDAIGRAYRLRKEADSKVTLGFLCKRASIPSTGYLSDVIKGRRALHPRYREALLAALGLTSVAAEFVEMLLARDDKDQPEAERAELEQRIAGHRKLLAAVTATLPQKLQSMFFSFEVFCAFGLFNHRATKEQLRGYFGAARGVELEMALHLLKAAALVEEDGDSLRLVSERINFIGSEDGMSHLEFLRLSILDAQAKVESWYPRRTEAFFAASILSVKASTYAEALPAVRERIQLLESSLESDAADRLVRFNVQIYPLD